MELRQVVTASLEIAFGVITLCLYHKWHAGRDSNPTKRAAPCLDS